MGVAGCCLVQLFVSRKFLYGWECLCCSSCDWSCWPLMVLNSFSWPVSSGTSILLVCFLFEGVPLSWSGVFVCLFVLFYFNCSPSTVPWRKQLLKTLFNIQLCLNYQTNKHLKERKRRWFSSSALRLNLSCLVTKLVVVARTNSKFRWYIMLNSFVA